MHPNFEQSMNASRKNQIHQQNSKINVIAHRFDPGGFVLVRRGQDRDQKLNCRWAGASLVSLYLVIPFMTCNRCTAMLLKPSMQQKFSFIMQKWTVSQYLGLS